MIASEPLKHYWVYRFKSIINLRMGLNDLFSFCRFPINYLCFFVFPVVIFVLFGQQQYPVYVNCLEECNKQTCSRINEKLYQFLSILGSWRTTCFQNKINEPSLIIVYSQSYKL